MPELEHWTASDALRKLPFCACGAPDEALEFLHWVLWSQTSWDDMSDEPWSEGADAGNRMQFTLWCEERYGGAYWLTLYVLSGVLCWTEHGGGVRFGWLLPDGERARRFLDTYGTEPDEWPRCLS